MIIVLLLTDPTCVLDPMVMHRLIKELWCPWSGDNSECKSNSLIFGPLLQLGQAMNFFADSPAALLKELQHDQHIHILQHTHTNIGSSTLRDSSVLLIDLSLNASEQQLYASSLYYRTNVRRGNTLVKIQNSSLSATQRISWGRKGLPEILPLESSLLRELSQGVSLASERAKTAQAIFGNVIQSLQNNLKVDLLIAQQMDCQDAQISYHTVLQSWIICSDEVSILAAKEKDLGGYRTESWKAAVDIGLLWFKVLASLDEKEMSQLKECLGRCTLVGGLHDPQQCLFGDKSHGLTWFTIVDNDSLEICRNLCQAQQFIQSLGMSFVKVAKVGTFCDLPSLARQLEVWTDKIFAPDTSNAEVGCIGSVIHFVAHGSRCQPKTIGIAKISSIHHSLLRMMPRFLSLDSSASSQSRVQADYHRQCVLEMQQRTQRAPYPLQYYTDLFNATQQLFIQLYPTDLDGHSSWEPHFARLLKLSCFMNEKNVELKHAAFLFRNEIFMKQFNRVSIQDFGPMDCKTKIIFLFLGLPGLPSHFLACKLEQRLEQLNLHCVTINIDQEEYSDHGIERIQQASTHISKQALSRGEMKVIHAILSERNNSLSHFIIDGNLCESQIAVIEQQLLDKGDQDCYYRKVIITDSDSTELNGKMYPFSLASILLSYYNTHEHKLKARLVHEKISNLQSVSRMLVKHENKERCNRQDRIYYHYPFKGQFAADNVHEFLPFLAAILAGNKLQNNYCSLILRLEKLEGDELGNRLDEDHICRLIKYAYPQGSGMTAPRLAQSHEH